MIVRGLGFRAQGVSTVSVPRGILLPAYHLVSVGQAHPSVTPYEENFFRAW